MQPIALQPGMRVRCVNADHYAGALRLGAEYTISDVHRDSGANINVEEKPGYNFYPYRFKPIVRVKMRARPSLDILLARALASFDKMSPEEKERHIRAQRESWARQDMD